jgi:hypothetical protein
MQTIFSHLLPTKLGKHIKHSSNKKNPKKIRLKKIISLLVI